MYKITLGISNTLGKSFFTVDFGEKCIPWNHPGIPCARFLKIFLIYSPLKFMHPFILLLDRSILPL